MEKSSHPQLRILEYIRDRTTGMMEPMNCWTRLFALLTLTLGTLVEGSAIAALSQTSSPRNPLPDQTELAQRVFRNQCAYINDETSVFETASLAYPKPGIRLDRLSIVQVLEETSNRLWARIRDARDPRINGYILVNYIDQMDDCEKFRILSQDAPTTVQPRGACYEVDKNLPVYNAARISSVSRQSLLAGDIVYQVSELRPEEDRIWIEVISRTNPPVEGWIEFRSPRADRNNLTPCQ